MAVQEMKTVASSRESVEGTGWAAFMGKECKEGEVQPESKQ